MLSHEIPARIAQPLATAILLLLPSFASSARADVVVLAAKKDNTLYQSATGSLSNGAGIFFFAGRTDQGALRRGLIAFDVASAIPPGSVVTSATLRLTMSRSKPGQELLRLHFLLDDWGEGTSDAPQEEGKGAPATAGDATWLHTFYPSSLWGIPGGVYSSTASIATPVDNEGPYSFSSAGMALDVQVWVNDPSTNFGWILIGNESTDQTTKRFDSREHGDVAKRPTLTVQFTPPVPVGACCLGGGDCQNLGAAECAAQGGTYHGVGTSCFPSPCVVPTGACCFANGSCLGLSGADCAAQGGTYHGDGSACATAACPVVLEPFVDALPIPAVAQPIVGSPGGAAEYEIRMQQFQQQLHRDLPPTTLWGYGGTFPGPAIEATRDLPVKVRWMNDLKDSAGNYLTAHYLPVDTCLHGPDMYGSTPRTVVHLHGGHVPTSADGYPEATFLPGQDALYEYPNHQPPATLWFHDHALGITRLNVYMGLAGLYVLRDAFELGLGLPSGEHEIPLVVQDRKFHADGSLDYPAAWEEHFFGDTMLVNGRVWPYLQVERGKYRFRMLNGCTSRTLTLALSDTAVFHQIGTDGGLLPAPVALTQVTIAPGERADVVIDFAGYSPGSELLLRNSAPAPFPGTPGAGVIPNVMKFLVVGASGHTASLPVALRPVVPLDPAQAVASRQFLLRKSDDPCTGSKWLINGLGWHDVTEHPKRGTSEIWSFVNDSGTVHPMHMHLVLFQVLDRQPCDILGDLVVPTGPAVPPAANEAGWKDTVQTLPREITRVIARFEDYTGHYPYHCHILEHEDHEMMRQFEVILGPEIAVYGCGVNPAGSMVHLSGSPELGASFTLGLDNPLGTQAAGSLPFLALALAPNPAHPCGTPLPGLGMAGPGAPGELLIDVGTLLTPIKLGPPWTGAGNPSPISLTVPNDPILIGKAAYAQGAMLDLTAAGGVGMALTDAAAIWIGP